MTEKTNAEIQDYAAKHITKQLGMPSGTDVYEICHTFETGPDRFADHKKSARLLDEATKIIEECMNLKADLTIVKEDLKEYFNGLSKNEYRDLNEYLNGLSKNVSFAIRADIPEKLDSISVFEEEIHRLESHSTGLLHEKAMLDRWIKDQITAAKAVLLCLREGKRVYDRKHKIINEHEIMHWLRMMGEDV